MFNCGRGYGLDKNISNDTRTDGNNCWDFVKAVTKSLLPQTPIRMPSGLKKKQ